MTMTKSPTGHNPVPVSAALRRRAGQFGFPVKGGMVAERVSIGMHAVPGVARRIARHIDCPYCRQPMQVFSGVFCRMVGTVDPLRAIAEAHEPVLMEVSPPGIDLAACETCKQSFFVPAPSGDVSC